MVRDFREDAGLITKAANPDQDWWKKAATAAALAWLAGIGNTSGYSALEAAVTDAIQAGMAEGQADALAAAAAKQGAGGLAIDRAFTAAYGDLAGNSGVAGKAQGTIERVIAGAGADIGKVLTDGAADGVSAGEMTAAATDAVTGTGSRSLDMWIGDAIQAAIGSGVQDLLSQVSQDDSDAMGMTIWQTDGLPCGECIDNEAGSPYAPQDLPDFPAHPRCQCEIFAADDIPSSYFSAYLLDAD
jgi:hypothetical protein